MESKFLYKALGSPVIPDFKCNKKSEICCICGQEEGFIKKTEIIGGSFTRAIPIQNKQEILPHFSGTMKKCGYYPPYWFYVDWCWTA